MHLRIDDPEIVRLLEAVADRLVDERSDYTGRVTVHFHYRQGVNGAINYETEGKMRRVSGV